MFDENFIRPPLLKAIIIIIMTDKKEKGIPKRLYLERIMARARIISNVPIGPNPICFEIFLSININEMVKHSIFII